VQDRVGKCSTQEPTHKGCTWKVGAHTLLQSFWMKWKDIAQRERRARKDASFMLALWHQALAVKTW